MLVSNPLQPALDRDCLVFEIGAAGMCEELVKKHYRVCCLSETSVLTLSEYATLSPLAG